MGEYRRDMLPDPCTYFEGQGVPLVGRGRWRTGPCCFHGGRDSLRVNTASGGWVCMSCAAKGGDVLAFHQQRHGLGFVEAARDLGAYVDDDRPHQGPRQAATLPAREAMQVAAHESLIVLMVGSDMRRKLTPCDHDWQRMLVAVGRLQTLAQEYRT